MKKFIPILAAVLFSCSAAPIFASAEGSNSVNVTVTISDGSDKPVLIRQNINVTDIDSDGKLTINDALFITHENCFSGGAATGYKSEEGQYGLKISKLWGKENNDGFGYYVDNIAANGLKDPVNEGNDIYAFVYTDTANWSDSYSWFDKKSADAKQGDELELTLSRAAFDANWAPVTLPVEGAVITVNGNATEYKTDANGKVTVKLENAGQNIISAKSDSLILVPPVSVVNAAETQVATTTAAPETTTAAETTVSSTDTTASSTAASSTSAASTTTAKAGTSSKNDSPKTGDMGAGSAIVILGSAVCAAFALRKKNEE